jgi:CheY-like chemotaxis protein
MKDYNFTGLKFLVVDDEELLREILTETFAMHGAHVDSAEGGQEAIQKIKATAYDVLISDVRMPSGDGFELVKAIAQLPERQKMKIFICSAYNDLTEEKISDLKIFQIIQKPFDIESLLMLVASSQLK